jgi:hypothetical protein
LRFGESGPMIWHAVLALPRAGPHRPVHGMPDVVPTPPVDDPADPSDEPEPEPPDLTGLTGLRRLSPAEVERTVDDLLAEFGASADGIPALPLPPPNHKHGFENTIETGNFSTDGLLALLDWADAVGDAATANVDLGCPLTSAFDACAEGYATRLLEAAWREPVDNDTRALAAQTWATATADSVPRNGLRALWELALMAPRFWYLSAETDASGRLTPSAMLSQLSYGLSRTMPSADLRARRDALVADDAVRALAEEMLDDPRAEETVLRFHRDWLNVAEGSALDKDPTLYPGFGPELADNFDVEFDAFVMRTLDDDAPHRRAVLVARGLREPPPRRLLRARPASAERRRLHLARPRPRPRGHPDPTAVLVDDSRPRRVGADLARCGRD